MKKKILPRLFKDRPPRTPIRVWVPGCSTGEEAYSIAIALLEFLDTRSASVPVQVFATDISKTLENKIEGVILALVDIDTARRALTEAREAREFAEVVIETVRQPLLVLDHELRVKSVNPAFCDLFRTSAEDTEKHFLFGLGRGQWNIAKLRELLEGILPKNSRFENFEIEAEFLGVGRKKLVLNARRVTDDGKTTQWILLAIEEVRG